MVKKPLQCCGWGVVASCMVVAAVVVGVADSDAYLGKEKGVDVEVDAAAVVVVVAAS